MNPEYQAILDQHPDVEEVVTEIDWGSGRGQGRRRDSMVTGGMSSPPRGIKRYVSYVPNYPEWRALEGRTGTASPILYAKARAYGMDHGQAMKLAIIGERYFEE